MRQEGENGRGMFTRGRDLILVFFAFHAERSPEKINTGYARERTVFDEMSAAAEKPM